jgi:hypothetical protein
MLYALRGDTIGVWSEAEMIDSPTGPCLQLTGVRALGGPDDRFALKRMAPADPGSAARELRFALCEYTGDPLHLNLAIRAEAWDGFGAGPTHAVFDPGPGEVRLVIDLAGLPRQAGTRLYRPSGPVGTPAPDLPRGDALPQVSFATGTRLLTGRGRERVEQLVPGDGLWTLDHGIRHLRWISRHTIRFEGPQDPRRPVRFDPGCLALDLPAEPLWLPPEHCVYVSGWRAELFFGLPEVLVPASQLTDWAGIERERGLQEITWHALLLESHEIVNAGGLLCETLMPRDALRLMPTRRERQEICNQIPVLRILGGRLSGLPARPLATAGTGTTMYLDDALV